MHCVLTWVSIGRKIFLIRLWIIKTNLEYYQKNIQTRQIYNKQTSKKKADLSGPLN